MPNSPVPAAAGGMPKFDRTAIKQAMRHDMHHFYREFLRHQRAVYASGGGMMTTYPSGRTELSYASAPYGEHALNAFASAKRRLAFRKELKREVQKIKRRKRARRTA